MLDTFVLVTLFNVHFKIWLDLQYLDREGISFCCRTTYDDNAIANAVEIYDSSRYFFFLFLRC